MQKVIVVYRSKGGFVQRYAEMIAKAVGADLADARGVDIAKLKQYDTIVFGGGLYAVGINGVGLIKKNLEALSGRRIIVFAAGASPPRPEIVNEVRDRNFDAVQQKRIRFFLLRGGFDYSKLSAFDKLLMQLMKKSLRRKKNPTPDERGMLAAYDTPVDFVSEKHIAPIIAAIGEE
jgi:menaquinone-dependent protoporphyrinogen IX oxidase